VREHETIEVVIRNLTAMEAMVSLECESLGAPASAAARIMEAWADARSADAAGLGGGGVSSRGHVALGGLPGGDGILAAALGNGAAPGGVKTVRDAASFGSEVFGAASTLGPGAHLASLNPHERATKPARRKYHLPNATPSGRAVTFDGSVGSEARGASGREKKASANRSPTKPERFAAKLSDAHERMSFSRGAGVKMAAHRAALEADALALASGQGAAFVCYPAAGTLPPYGEFRCVVTLVSDMPGEYFDRLVARVGDLPPRVLPLRAGINGSPLVAQATKHDPIGYVGRRPNGFAPGVVGLNWGARPCGAPPTTKRFFCVNRGPADVEVQFTPWLNPVPADPNAYFAGDTDEGRVCASSTLVVDEVTGRVGVKIRGAGVMCARRGPFRVSPEGPVVVPKRGGRVAFEVEFAYAGARARRFVGSVVSRQRVLTEGDRDVIPSPRITLELGCAATRATAARRDPKVSPERADAMERLATRNPVSARLAGGFARNAAAPPKALKPLVVRLEATAFTPRLTPDAPGNFGAWFCRASADRGEPEYFKSVTLGNPHSEPVAFAMTCADPFEIFDVESSVPQIGLLDRGDSTPSPPSALSRSSFAGCDAATFKTIAWRVPPRESVTVTLRFAPPVADEFDDGTIDREDYLAEGALVILYDNDDIQSFALSAEYRHPELVAVRPGGRSAADDAAAAADAEAAEKDATTPLVERSRALTSIDLGEAHVRGWGSDPTLASRRFTLVNASAADARWRCEVAGRNPGVFSVTPSSGVARGRGRHGAPGRVEVEVRFAPRAEMRYEAALRFEVDEGRGCEVEVVARGTLDEAKEGRKMPRDAPVER
jgi:hypothetical protein